MTYVCYGIQRFAERRSVVIIIVFDRLRFSYIFSVSATVSVLCHNFIALLINILLVLSLKKD